MAEKKTLTPVALTVEEAAKTLRVPREWLGADIAAGAPTNAEGTVNLEHHGAWLATTVTSKDGRR